MFDKLLSQDNPVLEVPKMKIAVISDVHGNLVALEAALQDIEREQVDQIVCLGDVATTGPQPHETVEKLKLVGCPVVMGNSDEWALNQGPLELHGDASEEEKRKATEIELWSAKQLRRADLDYMRTFKSIIELSLGNDKEKLLCFHGSPKSNKDFIHATTLDVELERMTSGTTALILAGGRAHTQMIRRFRKMLIINPGSVGLPYEHLSPNEVINPLRAEYAILSYSGRENFGIELRRVPFDKEALNRAVLNSGMPNSEWYIKDWKMMS